MFSHLRCVTMIAACVSAASVGLADQPKAKPSTKIELRWVERTCVDGLTEKLGIPESCGDGVLYLHKKPALVLTPKDVKEAQLKQFDLKMNDMVVHHYSVCFDLTNEARERLAANCPAKAAQVTVVVDGKALGWSHYTTDNDAKVSETIKARSFNAEIGSMQSRDRAQKIVDAFK